MMNKKSKIYVAGHTGLVGSAITRALQKQGYKNLVYRDFSELDLRDFAAVKAFFDQERPEYVILAAAKVGGILANSTYPADFIYDNLAIEMNVIKNAYEHKVKKLLFLGSSCIYPKLAKQPIQEEYFMTGKLEETNEPYAVAKIAGIVTCQAFNKQFGTNYISVMPTNLYGIYDNFELNSSHVLPALIRKFHDAKVNNLPEVTVWGTGKPRREFLFVDDLADALVYLINHYDGSEILNIGTGEDLTIAALAKLVKKVVGYKGKIIYDTSKPDGTPRKQLNVSRLNATGWKAKTPLEEGVKITYDWFLANQDKIRR
jgi:GDP-L-fucose synthase